MKRLLLVVAGLGMAMLSVVVRNVVDDRDDTAWQIAREQIDNLRTEAAEAVRRCAADTETTSIGITIVDTFPVIWS